MEEPGFKAAPPPNPLFTGFSLLTLCWRALTNWIRHHSSAGNISKWHLNSQASLLITRARANGYLCPITWSLVTPFPDFIRLLLLPLANSWAREWQPARTQPRNFHRGGPFRGGLSPIRALYIRVAEKCTGVSIACEGGKWGNLGNLGQ